MGQRLSEKAMLVKLSISQWTAQKCDKRVTEKVRRDFAASQDAGRYNKRLIAEEAIQAISQAANEARSFHYEQTLPWRDDGARILPAANFDKYSRGMRERREKFERPVASFLPRYQEYIEDAKSRLNGMFDEADYPPADEIAARYSFETAIDPLPDAGDFRVSLQAEDAARIESEIEARNAAAVQAAMRDVWGRLHEAVSRLSERLSDPEAVFRDSLVGNLLEMVNVLPRLNLTEDPALDRMTADVRARLCSHNPETLRAHKPTRAKVAADAQAILDTMAAYCGS